MRDLVSVPAGPLAKGALCEVIGARRRLTVAFDGMVSPRRLAVQRDAEGVAITVLV